MWLIDLLCGAVPPPPPAPPLDAWVSPQLQQALVGGLIVAVGWGVARAGTLRSERRLRQTRSNDLQRALLAEIRANVTTLARQYPSADEATDLIARFQRGTFTPSLRRNANDRVYAAVIAEINILPKDVIDPIVIYYRLLVVMSSQAEDMANASLKDRRKRAPMMVDYLNFWRDTLNAGVDAMDALKKSLPANKAPANNAPVSSRSAGPTGR